MCVVVHEFFGESPKRSQFAFLHDIEEEERLSQKKFQVLFCQNFFYILIDILPRLRILEFEKVPSESRDKKVMTAYYKL